jgi:hypothetical protein
VGYGQGLLFIRKSVKKIIECGMWRGIIGLFESRLGTTQNSPPIQRWGAVFGETPSPVRDDTSSILVFVDPLDSFIRLML